MYTKKLVFLRMRGKKMLNILIFQKLVRKNIPRMKFKVMCLKYFVLPLSLNTLFTGCMSVDTTQTNIGHHQAKTKIASLTMVSQTHHMLRHLRWGKQNGDINVKVYF